MIGSGLFWGATVALALGTLALRFSFIYLLGRVEPPDWFYRALRYIPPSVLAALVAPAVVLPQGDVGWLLGKEKLAAGILAALAAWRVRNMLATIVTGMAALALLEYLG